MFYAKSWVDVSIKSFIMKLDQYIRWYGEKRIKLSLGEMSPIDYRKSLVLIKFKKHPHLLPWSFVLSNTYP
jgi:hypothetical protein